MPTTATDEPSRSGPRRPDLDELYCINPDGSRNVIHTADVRGRYQTRKKLIWTILIGVYIALPWIEVGGHPAVLLDIEHRNFFLFGQTFNAQDFWLAFFVLTGIGFSLFVISSLFGRLWCGYGCPQTVFLDGVFRRIERWIDGGATARKRLAESGWTIEKVVRRGAKWGMYLAVSIVLSHTMLGYFMPIETVVAATTESPAAHPTAFTFALIATVIIYFNFTWFREQLCIVICPYGRLQGVLYDADTVNVGYDAVRGEPRGRHTESERGDCIDCYRCVAVCPTGIDIRNGTQLECIGCANCIDACDEVMTKVGQPTGLVRYDSQRGFETGQRKFARPRLFLYAALLLVGVVVFAFAAGHRTPFEVDVLRQRGAPFTIEDGSIRNGFLIRIVNKQPEPHEFEVVLPTEVGIEYVAPIRQFELASLANRSVPVFVRCDAEQFEPGREIAFEVRSDLGVQSVSVPLVGPHR